MGKFAKNYGKVVGKDTKGFPGWNGPGYIKKTESAPKSKRAPKVKEEEADAELVVEPLIPIELQQLLLDVYRDAFPAVLLSDALQTLLQEVKKALYERDFTLAFGREEFLEAYSIRWSPSRTLCYQSILVDLQDHLAEIFPICKLPEPNTESPSDARLTMNVVSFGGGAAEVVAFGGFLRHLQLYASRQIAGQPRLEPSEGLEKLYLGDDALINGPNQKTSPLDHSPLLQTRPRIDLCLVDTARWQNVVSKLQETLTSPPPVSKYASFSAKTAGNHALITAADFGNKFLQEDVLHLDENQLTIIAGGQPKLLTLLFTLNELYTFSRAKTTIFLLNLTAAATAGTLLLVVDSPGSYSATTVGTEAKKYPMHWLLDHTLLKTQTSGGKETPNWVKLVSEESKWFRIPEGLRYPIPLENMRYQMHFYSRV